MMDGLIGYLVSVTLCLVGCYRRPLLVGRRFLVHSNLDTWRTKMDALTFWCEFDLALTYALRRPTLAHACATRAFFAAHRMGRPDLVFQANALMGVLS
jgi:hypothetical protein